MTAGFAITIILILIVLYMLFTGLSYKSIEANLLGGLISSAFMYYIMNYFENKCVVSVHEAIGGEFSDKSDCDTQETKKLKSLLKSTNKDNASKYNFDVGKVLKPHIDENNVPHVNFSATPESAGGVLVENPEQYLYTLIIMRIPKKSKDLRNTRKLVFLAGNIPAQTVSGENGDNINDYKLRISDAGNVLVNKMQKITRMPGSLVYFRVLRQPKPIKYNSPKNDEKYDIDTMVLSNNLQSVGELYYNMRG